MASSPVFWAQRAVKASRGEKYHRSATSNNGRCGSARTTRSANDRNTPNTTPTPTTTPSRTAERRHSDDKDEPASNGHVPDSTIQGNSDNFTEPRPASSSFTATLQQEIQFRKQHQQSPGPEHQPRRLASSSSSLSSAAGRVSTSKLKIHRTTNHGDGDRNGNHHSTTNHGTDSISINSNPVSTAPRPSSVRPQSARSVQPAKTSLASPFAPMTLGLSLASASASAASSLPRPSSARLAQHSIPSQLNQRNSLAPGPRSARTYDAAHADDTNGNENDAHLPASSSSLPPPNMNTDSSNAPVHAPPPLSTSAGSQMYATSYHSPLYKPPIGAPSPSPPSPSSSSGSSRTGLRYNARALLDSYYSLRSNHSSPSISSKNDMGSSHHNGITSNTSAVSLIRSYQDVFAVARQQEQQDQQKQRQERKQKQLKHKLDFDAQVAERARLAVDDEQAAAAERDRTLKQHAEFVAEEQQTKLQRKQQSDALHATLLEQYDTQVRLKRELVATERQHDQQQLDQLRRQLETEEQQHRAALQRQHRQAMQIVQNNRMLTEQQKQAQKAEKDKEAQTMKEYTELLEKESRQQERNTLESKKYQSEMIQEDMTKRRQQENLFKLQEEKELAEWTALKEQRARLQDERDEQKRRQLQQEYRSSLQQQRDREAVEQEAESRAKRAEVEILNQALVLHQAAEAQRRTLERRRQLEYARTLEHQLNQDEEAKKLQYMRDTMGVLLTPDNTTAAMAVAEKRNVDVRRSRFNRDAIAGLYAPARSYGPENR